MDQAELRQLLRELRFSAHLTDATAEKLAGLLSFLEFSAGTIIFEEGAVNRWFYLIVEGEVALEMCVPARGCTRILTLGRGDILAWSAILGEGRMTAGAHALTDARLLVVSAQALNKLCASDHNFGYEIVCGVATELSKRLVATRLQLLDLYDAPATSEAFADRA